MTEPIFAESFETARRYFLDAAHEAGAEINSFTHPLPGPHGEPLMTDAAWISPSPEPSCVLVTVSGTHGVEGYCGSGAQIDWLRRREATHLPEGTAALLVHAINPYGFAWSRRVTHENVDLNRNWIDFGAALPGSPEYDQLADLLAPAEWNEDVRRRLRAGAHAYISAHTEAAFKQAVTGGQYSHAEGLFYGGTGPTWSRDTLTAIFRERLRNLESVAVIDYHSGLGASGYGEIITTALPDSAAFARARDWYGARVRTIGGSVSATIAGDWVSSVPALAEGAAVTGVAIEFGTVAVLQVLEALVADNWLHCRGSVDAPEAAGIRKELRDAFYVDSDLWRGMILGQSLAACRQAIAGLDRK
jgi:hypothetical protein